MQQLTECNLELQANDCCQATGARQTAAATAAAAVGGGAAASTTTQLRRL